jgi:hypothetical protein
VIPEDADRLHALTQRVPVASALALVADLEVIGHAVADIVGNHPLLDRIREILVLADEVAQAFESLRSTIEEAAQHHNPSVATNVGYQSPPIGRPGMEPMPRSSETISRPNRRRDVEERAADLLAALPVRDENNRKTVGRWIDEDGQEHGPLVSGRTGGYKEAVEQLRVLGIGPGRGDLWVAAHVEVKLAVQMRQTEARAITLAVNNVPCFEGQWSCDRLLPQILKSGQSIAIHWPGGKRVYRGRKDRDS